MNAKTPSDHQNNAKKVGVSFLGRKEFPETTNGCLERHDTKRVGMKLELSDLCPHRKIE